MPSEKTPIIEWLFDRYYDESTDQMTKADMSLIDVQEAIRHFVLNHGSKLSDRNPANFMKDIVRGSGASKNWPKRLALLGWTGEQSPGDGNVFKFVKLADPAGEPFPDIYKPSPTTPCFTVQSVSMPLAARDLGRSDEPWIIQTAVNLRVVETYFATVSPLNVIQITHLQMSIKLRRTEIDAVFYGIRILDDGQQQRFLITCEAKQWRERILDHQVLNQAKAAFEETAVDFVVPIAIRAIRGKGFYVVEFHGVERSAVDSFEKLEIQREAVFELKPPVKGI